MPGYYVHLATVNPKIKENRNFIYGVEMPDLLKKYFKTYGLNGAREKYDSIKINGMPDFSTFELMVQQIEKSNCRDGMHYGFSSNPDFMYFWNNLSEEQKRNPFYIGYLWHLLTDLLMYVNVNIESKFEIFAKTHANDENIELEGNNNIEYIHEIECSDENIKRNILNLLISYKKIRSNIDNTDIIFKFMGNSFVLEDVRMVYEIIKDSKVDKLNFRKKIKKYCEKIDEKEDTKNGYRPSEKYKFKPLKGDIWL